MFSRPSESLTLISWTWILFPRTVLTSGLALITLKLRNASVTAYLDIRREDLYTRFALHLKHPFRDFGALLGLKGYASWALGADSIPLSKSEIVF